MTTAVDPHVAACNGVDLNLFSRGDRENVAVARRRAQHLARAYCRDCRIRRACDTTADTNKDPGLWGGYWRTGSDVYVKTPMLDYLIDDDTRKGG